MPTFFGEVTHAVLVELVWSNAALPGLVVGVLDLALAGVLLTVRPGGRANRAVAALLLAAGTSLVVFFGLRRLMLGAADAYGTMVVDWVAYFVFLWAYLRVLATLDAPLAAPLRTRWARWGSTAAFGALATIVVLAPELVIAEILPDDVFIGWDSNDTALAEALLVASLPVFLFGLATAWSAFRRAVGPIQRRRAGWFLAAFGLHDVLLIAWIAYADVLDVPGLPSRAGAYVYNLGPVVAQTVLVGGLSYGVLRNQVLGIEIGLKRTIHSGTAVALLVAAYVAVLLPVQSLVDDRWAGTLTVLVTAAVLLAFLPMRRVGARVANALMPDVEASQAYLDARRLEVYRAALEESMTADGTLLATDRPDLVDLRDRLGLTERDHAVMEHAVRQGRGLDVRLRSGSAVLGKYRVEREIGAGGHGTTFLAHDEVLDRRVVIKALRRGASTERVLEEARRLAMVRHPRVVRLIDVERVGRDVVIIMEYLEGGTLAERIEAAGPIRRDWPDLASDLLDATAAVHAAGLVHGDIKPSNVLFDGDGAAYLSDLGTARPAAPDDTLTVSGLDAGGAGTPRYMSPEQARGRSPGPRSDVYALAATLYEAWSGAPLVPARPGESGVEVRVRVASARGPPALATGDAELDAWFERALQPDPNRRFGDVDEMASALARVVPGGRTRSVGERQQ